MCGIAGFAEASHDPDEARAILRRMTDLIRYRGPDGEGQYADERAALGHRRLSIIDLEGGAQPMFNGDRSLAVVFNGEIYNYRELRAELQAAGHTFATAGDTEVLLHGYEEWGSALPTRLRGMFAFVLWDKAASRLFGARDLFGIKPLYYYRDGGLLLFASEIKCFLAHPRFVKRLNEQRLPDYLSIEYLPDEETMFEGVYKLPGGHRFTWQDGRLAIEPYDEIRYHIDETLSLADWAERLDDVFARSVAAHRIADVEVGCFLSSGVDSALVTGEVAAKTAQVKSFSVGYAERRYSELPQAEALSRAIGVPCLTNTVDADGFFAANRLIQWYLDEPMPNPAEVPLYFLARNARRYVKVVLSGEGADELFGGYPLYSQAVHFMRYQRLVPAPLRRALGAAAAGLPPFVKGRGFLRRGAGEPWQRCLRANYVFADTAQRNALLRRRYAGLSPAERFRPWFDEAADLDEPTQLQWVDMHTWMPNDILLKADRMSMANSLELRVPFLDKEVLEAALSLPLRYRCSGSKNKIALRAMAARRLPAEVANRRKLGFPVPLNDWLRQDKYQETVRAAFTSEAAGQFFDTKALCRLLDDHRSGRARNMTKIWSVYSFLLWYGLYFESSAPPQELYGPDTKK